MMNNENQSFIFNIRAKKENINSCNGTEVIPAFNVQVALKPGGNIIEFAPDLKAIQVPVGCGSGMYCCQRP